jgi:protein involved in polysaccharide export with SLBB domain
VPLYPSIARIKNRFSFATVLVALALAGGYQLCVGMNAPAQAEDNSSTSAKSAVAANSQTPIAGTEYKIGDRLKITFFENVDVDGNSDGDRQRSDRSFHQRMDISGEYLVDENGTISIPLLGSIDAAGKTEAALTEALSKPFEKVIGRVGFINVVISEQQPIYIIGPVKNPGVYKYLPGLTVLHAVALAGGFDNGVSEIWHLVEAVRESQNSQTSLDKLKRLLAREAVLKAERDHGSVDIPRRLVELTSEGIAKTLVDTEKERRESELQLQKTRLTTLSTNIDNLLKSIEVRRGRIGFIDASITARSGRLGNLRDMRRSGSITDYTIVQAQADLADTQDRRQDMLVSIADAESALDQAKQQQAEFGKDGNQKLDGELMTIADEISTLTKTLASGAGLSNTMRKIAAANELTVGRQDTKIEIIRRTPSGNVVVAAEPTTSLEAGDLVRISLPNEETP